MALDVARQARLLAVLLRFVVLLTAFEQAILASVVVLGDFGGIVACARRMLRIVCLARIVRRFGGLVELPVAGVVLVPAAFFGHLAVSHVGLSYQHRQNACRFLVSAGHTSPL